MAGRSLTRYPRGFYHLSRPIPIGSISYGQRRSAAPCSSRTQEIKNPTEINPVGFLVLATSYSRTAYRRTTIGAAAFHCRVRNGNGWGHCAIITRRLVKPKLARGGMFRGGLSSTSPENLVTDFSLGGLVRRLGIGSERQSRGRLSERTRCSLKSAYWENLGRNLQKIDCATLLIVGNHSRWRGKDRLDSRNNQAERVISTTELNTLLCLYP